MKGFRKLGEPLFSQGLTARLGLGTRMTTGGVSDTTAPTFTITALSAVANVVAMQIVASEEVTGFEVGDITATGSLASFATADNITFTVSWTLAAGANTMDIPADVCTDAAGNGNEAATQFVISYTTLTGAALDTWMNSAQPTADNSADTSINIGESRTAVSTRRTLIEFDLSTIGNTILSSILSLYAIADLSANAGALKVYRSKVAWTALANWNTYDGTNNWPGGAGGFGASDCEQTAIGSKSLSAAETLNEYKNITLTPTTKTALDLGNGWLLKMETELDDAYTYISTDNATEKPLLKVVHRP